MNSQIFRTTANHLFTYKDLDYFQKKYAEKILKENQVGTYLLAEVEPVITVGRRAQKSDFLFPMEVYAAHGIDIYPVERGGLLTYHGPGQWVFFVVDKLERFVGDSRGVKKAICFLLSSLSDFLFEKYSLQTHAREDAYLGLWSVRSQKKVASIGIHVNQGVLQHGLCFNVYQTPKSFYGISPCGLSSDVSYICSELGIDEKNSNSFFTEIGNEWLRYVNSSTNKN